MSRFFKSAARLLRGMIVIILVGVAVAYAVLVMTSLIFRRLTVL